MNKMIIVLLLSFATSAFAKSYQGELNDSSGAVVANLNVSIQGSVARMSIQSREASCIPQFSKAVSNGQLYFGGLLTPAKARFYLYQAQEVKCYGQIVNLKIYTDRSGNPTGFVSITGKYGRGSRTFFAN